ncbi:MAG: PQQ-dependent sugar dehydrogenase [Gammaproteobacteria bacterium]|nr:PQQ-dependent sugar dehydrogenase [Gammaproteobacteria bacterium]
MTWRQQCVLFALAAGSLCACSARDQPLGVDPNPPNATGQQPAFAGQTRAPARTTHVAFEVRTLTQKLHKPWSLAFLPTGNMLVTERPGRLRVVGPDGALSVPVLGLPTVDTRGQGGLLEVAVDPAFTSNQLIYWTYAEPQPDGTNHTALARGKLIEGAAPAVENVQVIYRQAPSLTSPGHFGGRLVFARDGSLFVTQGDRMTEEGRGLVQKLDTLQGKIVRLSPDGSIPPDNPYVGNAQARAEIWSLGHRNVQAAAINPTTGELWAVEHGTRGGDEINVVRKGHNYGWPIIAYGIEYWGGAITGDLTAQAGLEQPLYYWDPVIAPSGMLFYTGALFPAWRGSLFVGGLASTNLVRLDLQGERVVGEERLLTDLLPKAERIRDVRQGPDGAIYLLTDSAQGRILKLVPKN